MENNKQENHLKFKNRPAQKLIVGFFLLVILSGFYAAFLLISNFAANTVNSLETRSYQMKALSQSVEKTLSKMASGTQESMNRHIIKTALESTACAGLIEEGIDLKPCMFEDGAIISVEDGKIVFPDDFPKEFRVDADQIKGGVASVTYLPDEEKDQLNVVYYALIKGSLYYLEWQPYAELEGEQRALFDPQSAMSGIEKAFNANLMLFPAAPGADGRHHLIYISDILEKEGCSDAEDYGITHEMLLRLDDNQSGETVPGEGIGPAETELSETEFSLTGMVEAEVKADSDSGKAGEEYKLLTVDGKSYELFMRKYNSSIMGEESILAFLVPLENNLRVHSELVWIILAAFFIVGMFFLVWFCSTLRLVRDHALTDRQKEEFCFTGILRRSVSTLAIGCLIILVASLLLFSLFRLYGACQQVDTAFSSMQQRIEENALQSKSNEAVQKKIYEGYARQIARIVNNHPSRVSASNLDALCSVIGADYVMLFDSEGNETLSNSRYVGLSLGTDPSSSTYDFRRLLTGTELITHDLAVDEATGEKHVMIGVSIGQPKDGENYEALLLAVPGAKIYGNNTESIDDVMASLAVGGLTAFSVDPETRLILHASKRSLVGKNVLDLGLPEKALCGGSQDFYTFLQKPSYVKCEEINSVLYFYAAEQSQIYRGVGLQAGISTLAAVILLAILAVFLLFRYGKFFSIWSGVGQRLEEQNEDSPGSVSGQKYSMDPSKRWKPYLNPATLRRPARAARLTAAVLLIIFLIIMGLRVFVHGAGAEESIISFILLGNWAKGFNLFAFTSILILLGQVLVVVFAIRITLYLVASALGTKGETIGRLLLNLTNYGGAIFFVYFSLYYLGFQVSTLLASLGLLSFAVSIGAKDLITDVIAGLSIVFEGEYQVGDIIEVGGYRGKILEIGVRTMKLEGDGGNIKIMRNQDVKNVVNLTRKNSWCTIRVNVPSDQPLEQVENLLYEELPKFGKTMPEILDGPVYEGIVMMERGSATLSISSECREEDYYTVQRAVNHFIQELFEKNGIRIM